MRGHRTKVQSGRDPVNGLPTYRAYCVKDCGWVGQVKQSRVGAERDGEGHEITMIRIEDES